MLPRPRPVVGDQTLHRALGRRRERVACLPGLLGGHRLALLAQRRLEHLGVEVILPPARPLQTSAGHRSRSCLLASGGGEYARAFAPPRTRCSQPAPGSAEPLDPPCVPLRPPLATPALATPAAAATPAPAPPPAPAALLAASTLSALSRVPSRESVARER